MVAGVQQLRIIGENISTFSSLLSLLDRLVSRFRRLLETPHMHMLWRNWTKRTASSFSSDLL